MERLQSMRPSAGERPSGVPCGISHVAVVTADLDGFRAFYEQVIGLQIAVVQGAGPRHGRGAVVFAGDAMLHVFEVPGYDPTVTGQDRRCSAGAGWTTSASPSWTRRPCAAFGTAFWPPVRPVGTSAPSARCSRSAFRTRTA